MKCCDELRDFLNGNIGLEYKEFKRLLLEYFSKYTNKLYGKYNCKIIVSTDISCAGATIGTSKIIINEYVIDNIYKGNLLFLIVFFHEISHLEQNIKIKEGNYSVNIIGYIKDRLLCKYQNEQNKKYDYHAIRSYYDINYSCESSEIDANANSILLLINFCLENQIMISKKMERELEIITYRIKSNQSKKRYVGGNVIFNTYYSSLDEAFDFAIKDHPEWLEAFPQLKKEYYIIGDKVYKSDSVNPEQFSGQKIAYIR